MRIHATLLAALLVACASDDEGSGKVGTEPTTTDPTTLDLPTTATEAFDPGRVTLHRLNRPEYDNTVRDLLGVTQRPAESFPPDDFAAGYDNIAANLSTSPLHVELYEAAALALADEVFDVPLAETADELWQAEDGLTATTGGDSGSAWNLWSNGTLSTVWTVPETGTYTLSTRVWGQQAGPDLVRASLGHDGFADRTFDVASTSEGAAEVFTVDVQLTAGPHTLEVAFLNDYYDPAAGADRNLLVDWLRVEGPTDVPVGENPLREALVPCATADRDCAERVFEPLASRAWRRPLEAGELDGLMSVYEAVTTDGGTFDDGLKYTLAATLMSPHFVYRVELDDEPESLKITALSDHEIASRLSYMLWSSMPDEELFRAAEAGELQESAGIEAQVRRMLADPKSQALVDNFAGQWLYIRAIDDIAPDPRVYPQFNEVLRASMREEVERFFASFVHEKRDMRELLTATEGEIDAVLAAHYDLAEPVTAWGTADLASVDRGGLLGMAGILAINSYPARTSPVIRGKYVLGQLMCLEPDPPPPGVVGLDEEIAAQTLREQLEQHRADPVCASCHAVMDEIGFGLEHFDGTGAWRDEDRGLPVDASGTLPGNVTFYGARELSDLLGDDDNLPRCITEQLFTYGLGRVPAPTDHDFLEAIEGAFASGGYTFEELAVALATSAPFRSRRGEE